MIVFSGELSDKCKHYIQNDATKTVRIVIATVIAMLSIPLAIASILWHWVFVIAIPLIFLIAILVLIPQINSPMKVLNLHLPKTVNINSEAISIESEKATTVRLIDNVKKVIDFGEWYHILFYFPHKSIYFICQKNLLIKGSIEEFEKLFEEKLVKKSK